MTEKRGNRNMSTIYFDMDGTIANFYGVKNWLDYLQKEDVFPYQEAETLLHFATFARLLNQIQKRGYRLGICSWLSKSGSIDYEVAVTYAKLKWLKKHLPSVSFDEIKIVKYGTPKNEICSDYGFLFDDEEPNRKAWERSGKGIAFDEKNILKILKLFT